MLLPSTSNSTLAIVPPVSEANAVRDTEEPDMYASLAGAVRETEGVPALPVVKFSSEEVAVSPEPLVETTAKWYVVEVVSPVSVMECEVTSAALLLAEP